MKKRIIILGCVFFAIIALWSAGWLYLAHEVRRNIELLANADGISAPRLACETLGVSGYPFRFDVDCTNGMLTSGDITASLGELRASVLVYRPTFLRLSAKGPLVVEDAFTGSASRVEWETLEGSIRLDKWRIARISVETTKPVWTDMLFGSAIASAEKFETHLLDIPERHEPEKGLAALATYSAISALAAPGFAVDSGDIELQTEIYGLPDDVRLLGEPDALRRWQQAGGKVQVVSLKGSDGERFADGSGTLGLDDQGRVEGQFTLTSRGVADLLFAAVPQQLKGTVIGPVGVDGSTRQVINFRAGIMLVGLVPLMMLSPLF